MSTTVFRGCFAKIWNVDFKVVSEAKYFSTTRLANLYVIYPKCILCYEPKYKNLVYRITRYESQIFSKG